jgi:hypothetical protein
LFHKVWDEELAAIAQRWADQCNAGHDRLRRTGNIFKKKRKKKRNFYIFSLKIGHQQFGDEANNENVCYYTV